MLRKWREEGAALDLNDTLALLGVGCETVPDESVAASARDTADVECEACVIEG